MFRLGDSLLFLVLPFPVDFFFVADTCSFRMKWFAISFLNQCFVDMLLIVFKYFMTNIRIHAIHHTKLMIIIGYAIGALPFFFNMQLFVNIKKTPAF